MIFVSNYLEFCDMKFEGQIYTFKKLKRDLTSNVANKEDEKNAATVTGTQ